MSHTRLLELAPWAFWCATISAVILVLGMFAWKARRMNKTIAQMYFFQYDLGELKSDHKRMLENPSTRRLLRLWQFFYLLSVVAWLAAVFLLMYSFFAHER